MYSFVAQHAGRLLIRKFVEGGEVFEELEDFKPSSFIASPDGDYDGLLGGKFSRMKYDSIKAMQAHLLDQQQMKVPIHGMEKPVYQYIRDTYPNRTPPIDRLRIFNFDIENKIEGPINVLDPKGEVTTISLHDSREDEYHLFTNSKGASWRKEDGYFKDSNIKIILHECFDEIDLLEQFIKFWSNNYPNIITGWNINGYDIPFLFNRIKKVLNNKKLQKLSPFNNVRSRTFTDDFGKEAITFTCQGVSVLDLIEVYKKFTYVPRESYSLDHIAEVEVNEKKLKYDEYEGLNDLYDKNFQKYADYNLVDVLRVNQIIDKTKLLDLVIRYAYDAGVNFGDVYSPVKVWDCLIFNYAASKRLVIPHNDSIERKPYGGGFVKEPIPGLYDWIVSFDLTSLYPHLIMGWNISPETLVNTLNKEQIAAMDSIRMIEDSEGRITVDIDHFFNTPRPTDVFKYTNTSMSPNGCFYSRDNEGLLSILIKKIFEERKFFKRKMLDTDQLIADILAQPKSVHNSEKLIELESQRSKENNMQQTRKILMNAIYGCLGNPHFRYTNYDNALAITSSGQLAIKYIQKRLNDFMNKFIKTENVDYCIAIDTDSVYFNFNDIVKKHMAGWETERIVNALDKFSKERIEPFIDFCYRELAEDVNCYEHKLFMDREVISEKAFWTGKKRYAMKVWDSEGTRYTEPKLKITGLEVVKSSTPAIIREELKSSINIILNKTETDMQDYISIVRDKFNKSTIEQIAFPRGVSQIDKYYERGGSNYIKGTPIGSKAAINFNVCVRNLNLSEKYDYIKGGEKIKFVPLKEPNPIHDNVIGFKSTFPPEFKLEKYVDYEHQFKKSFIQPLTSMLDAIGWKAEKPSATLDDFFI